MIILGINGAYHESAAALVIDGRLVAAVEEERLSGIKHGKKPSPFNAHELPWRAIKAVLALGGVRWKDVNAIAYSLDPEARRRPPEEACHQCISSTGNPRDFGHPEAEGAFLAGVEQARYQLLKQAPHAAFHFVPHHLAHAWYAFAFSDADDAAFLVLDGIGEWSAASWGRILGRRKIELMGESPFPNSLGLAWEKTARFLGMTEYDACKVMALASSRCDGISNDEPASNNRLFGFDGTIHVNQAIFDIEDTSTTSSLEVRFQGLDTAEVAWLLQKETEDTLIRIADFICDETGISTLAYGGGVALNCVANTKLLERSRVQRLLVAAASHDAGTAPGAAWHVWCTTTKKPIPEQDLRLSLYSGIPTNPGASFLKTSDLALLKTARLLSAGEIVGIAVGRCEFGPRALGARSLLASADDPQLSNTLAHMKGRMHFEPFAISVLKEEAHNIFSLPSGGKELARAMLLTAKALPPWRKRLQHLMPTSGELRIQVVEENLAPWFHHLLQHYLSLTGLPYCINTSFNVRGRPIAGDATAIWKEARDLGLKHLLLDDTLHTTEQAQFSGEETLFMAETP